MLMRDLRAIGIMQGSGQSGQMVCRDQTQMLECTRTRQMFPQAMFDITYIPERIIVAR
jgi:hypothetical protein